jgi:hypothetical protein
MRTVVVTQREVTEVVRSGYDEDRNGVTDVQCAKRAREVEERGNYRMVQIFQENCRRPA